MTGLAEAEFRISGMTCAACVATIEKHFITFPGIEKVSVNLVLQNAVFQFDPVKISYEAISDEIEDLGFGAEIKSSTVFSAAHDILKEPPPLPKNVPSDNVSPSVHTPVKEHEEASVTLGSTIASGSSSSSNSSPKLTSTRSAESILNYRTPDVLWSDNNNNNITTNEDDIETTVSKSLKESKETSLHALRFEVLPLETGGNGKPPFGFAELFQWLFKKKLGQTDYVHIKHTTTKIQRMAGVKSCVCSRPRTYSNTIIISLLYNPHQIGARTLLSTAQQSLLKYKVNVASSDSTIAGLQSEYLGIKKTFLQSIIPSILVVTLAMTSHERLPSFLKQKLIPGVSTCGIVMLLLTTPVHFVCGWRFHRHAYQSLTRGLFTMDLLVSISTNVTYFYSCLGLLYGYIAAKLLMIPPLGQGLLIEDHGEIALHYSTMVREIPHYFETPAAVICAILLGKTIETRVRLQSAKAIRRASEVENASCTLQFSTQQLNSDDLTVDVEEHRLLPQSSIQSRPAIERCLLHINDIVLVENGKTVPTDGMLLSAPVIMDESIVTGESTPVYKTTEEFLIGGSKPIDSSLIMKVSEIGDKTFLGQIQTLIEKTNTKKSATQLFADYIASKFIPSILLFALMTTIVWTILVLCDVVSFKGQIEKHEHFAAYQVFSQLLFISQFPIAVIAVACPCALGLAMPTALALATSCGAKFGILVKNIEGIEKGAKKFTDIIFDKTGTLTMGHPKLTSITTVPFMNWPHLFQQIRLNPLLINRFLALLSSDNCTVEVQNKMLTDHQINSEIFLLLWVCGSIQTKSEHPIGKSLVQYYRQYLGLGCSQLPPLVPPIEFSTLAGQGISGLLNISSLLPPQGHHHSNPIMKCHLGNYRYCAAFVQGEERNRLLSAMKVKKHLGESRVFVIINDTFIGCLGLRDSLKEGVKEVIKTLETRHNANIWICTGDTSDSARLIAEQLGIDFSRVRYEMTPQEKADFLYELTATSRSEEVTRDAKKGYQKMNHKKRVMMVGDGINDAAALNVADLGIAVGTHATLTATASDVLLLRSDLWDLLSFLDLAKATTRIIRLNFLWAFGFNLLGLPVAAGVFYPRLMLPPAIAGALMALSSIVVVMNSVSLTRFQPKKRQQSKSAFDLFSESHHELTSTGKEDQLHLDNFESIK